MNCPECLLSCCNNQLHEIRNGIVSLSYVAKQIRRGNVTDDMLDRMDHDINRIDSALKGCRRFK